MKNFLGDAVRGGRTHAFPRFWVKSPKMKFPGGTHG